jgi:lysophospholipase L1-like esterase
MESFRIRILGKRGKVSKGYQILINGGLQGSTIASDINEHRFVGLLFLFAFLPAVLLRQAGMQKGTKKIKEKRCFRTLALMPPPFFRGHRAKPLEICLRNRSWLVISPLTPTASFAPLREIIQRNPYHSTMKRLATLTFLLTMLSTQAQTIKFLALGDSYTIGESVKEEERWPEVLAAELRKKGKSIDKPKIIATTGWRTDQLKKAIEDAQLKPEYNLVSLLIGVNNQYQGKSAESYAPEFEELLNIAIKLAGGKKENVFVVSIPDYGFTPFGQPKQEQITKALDEYNAINKKISKTVGVRYVNITDISRKGFEQPDLVADDKLHPSGVQYKLWVERILEGFK